MTSREDFRPELLGPLLRDLTADGRSAELPVRGDSMRPLLRDGDRVQVVPVGGIRIRLGDVLVLAMPSGPVIHRAVGWWPSRQGRNLLTKGDGTIRLDAPVRGGAVVGRAVARVREGRLRRLDGPGMRARGRCRAIVSLVVGLAVEASDRVRGRARSQGA